MSLFDHFQRIYVINLPSRTDRRRAVSRELRRAGLAAHDPRLTVFPAIRPDRPAGFPSIGARGCFLSQLAVLKQAQVSKLERFLLAEDDLALAPDFAQRSLRIAQALETRDWNLFYGGHRIATPPEPMPDATGLALVPSSQAIETAHLLGFQGAAMLAHLIAFLEAILARPPGDSAGGPMHVDGAYTTFRRAFPAVSTLAAIPPLGHQRASRSDIHPNAWYDRQAGVRSLVGLARTVRNAARR